MARQVKGTVVPPAGKRRSWAIRFQIDKKRHFVTLGRPEDGWNRQRAEAELRHVLSDVERGVWKPYVRPTVEIPKEAPTFEEFVAEWIAVNSPGWKRSTLVHYNWALEGHLLPYFGKHRLSKITVKEVDRYRSWKASQPKKRAPSSKRAPQRLSPRSVNNTIRALTAILELAVDYGHLESNPAHGSKRLLKVAARTRSYLQPEQVKALLKAAERLDEEAISKDNRRRQVLLATLALAGLRISEALDLRWGDVDPSGRWLDVEEAKTAAGVRRVDLTPALRELLLKYRARTPHSAEDRVFPTWSGKRDNPSNIRNRLIRWAVELANEELAAAGHQTIGHISPHSLRRTYISLLLAAGANVPYVMGQAGHTDPRMTLSVYAGVIASDTDHGAALDDLIGGL